LRIAFDTRWIRTSNLEGVGGYTMELLLKLLEIDTSNDYLAFFDSEDKLRYFKRVFKPERFKNLEVRHVRFSLASLWANGISLPRFLKKNKIDIYHVPFFAFSPFKMSPKLIATVYDIVPFLYPRYSVLDCPTLRLFFNNRYLLKTIMSRADKFVVASQHSIDYLVKEFGFSPDKFVLVRPGIAPGIARVTDEDLLKTVASVYRLPRDYILFMGELGLHKRITPLIKGYMMLPEELRRKHKLVIVGRGEKLYPRDVDVSVRRKALPEGVIIPGYIRMEDKPAVYSMAKAFVSPTLYEGFPLFMLEAMACGVPVAASNIPLLREFVGDSMLKFDPEQPRSVCAALKRILTDDSSRASLIKKGKDMVSTYTWESTARNILQVYNNVL